MERLELAKQIAKAAGAFIVKRRAEGFGVDTKSQADDLVTEVDRESEQFIFARIRAALPDDALLGEEQSYASPAALRDRLDQLQDTAYVWIVDPIDGTSNFVQGLPGYTVSIGVMHRGAWHCGAVYDPNADELFWAGAGHGAWLNDERIAVSPEPDLRRGMVAFSLPSSPDARELTLREIANVSANTHKVRTLGSAALHLAYVACGRLTGYWQRNLNAWDFAGGAVIVAEAGGQMTDLLTNETCGITTTDILASNGLTHAALTGHIQAASRS